MASQAVIRCRITFVTIDAKTHCVIHCPLRHSHLRNFPMAHDAVDLRANVCRMVETDMRLFKKSVDTLPGHVLTPFGMVAQLLNPRIVRVADVFVTTYAEVDAGNPSACAGSDAAMAVLAFDSNLVKRVDVVWKIDRLLRLRFDVEKVL